MKRIELTGPSGVGKTTLFLEICDIKVEKRPFITVREAYVKAAGYDNITLSNIKPYLLQKALKTGLFKAKAFGISKNILQRLYSDQREIRDSYQKINVSFNILYQQYRAEMDPNHVLKRITTFLSKVDEIEMLEKNLPEGEKVLFDEGVLHHHFGVTKYGFENFSDRELSKDKVLNPFGIISCEQTEDAIFNQSIKRKKKGVKTFSQGHLEGEKLRERIRITIKSNERKIASFKKRNIPVLHINTGKPVDENIEKIIRFTRDLN